MWIWLVNAMFNNISVILSVLLAMETGETNIPDAVIDPTL